MRQNNSDSQAKSAFAAHKDDLGYGLLLKRCTDKVVDATPAQIKEATRHSIPKAAPMFWSFRGMVVCGFMMLFIFAAALYYNAKHAAHEQRWLLRLAFYGFHCPGLPASLVGWLPNMAASLGQSPVFYRPT